jgi:hypothetical protein
MNALSDIHMAAYAAHIRNNRGPGPTDARLALAANEAGFQAVWDTATRAARAVPIAPQEVATEYTGTCDRGGWASYFGHLDEYAQGTG